MEALEPQSTLLEEATSQGFIDRAQLEADNASCVDRIIRQLACPNKFK
jgi:hypothetical protein